MCGKIVTHGHAWFPSASQQQVIHSRLMGNLMSSASVGGAGNPTSVNNLVPTSESDNPSTSFPASESGRRPETHHALSRHNEFLMRLQRSHLAATSSHHSGEAFVF